MADSFYFYDLETSGFNPREARIMQFAGQRTDMNLNPIGEPCNVMISLSEDTIPEPDAVLVTGITPQQTRSQGLSEAEFLKFFHDEIALPDTIFVGYNNVRFDDEFMRYLHYRNFYDPYEWQWQDRRSRWDMLDVVRMTRALRPEGINWPFDPKGNPTNRLELLTSLNKLEHSKAHDALSDVHACIAVARLIKNKQPKLFGYLLKMRDKKLVSEFVSTNELFLHTSGKYPSEFEKTTIATAIAPHPKRQGVLVYDLRFDPAPVIDLNPAELVSAWRNRKDESPRLPVKSLLFNRCPAVAPLSVLDSDSSKRLKIDQNAATINLSKLKTEKFQKKLLKALEVMNKEQQAAFVIDENDVDQRLYDGFFNESDKTKMSILRAAEPEELSSLDVTFKDQRLEALLPLYKARNFPAVLTEQERNIWEQFRYRRLLVGKESSRLAKYFTRINELQARSNLADEQMYLLEELVIWGNSIIPAE